MEIQRISYHWWSLADWATISYPLCQWIARTPQYLRRKNMNCTHPIGDKLPSTKLSAGPQLWDGRVRNLYALNFDLLADRRPPARWGWEPLVGSRIGSIERLRGLLQSKRWLGNFLDLLFLSVMCYAVLMLWWMCLTRGPSGCATANQTVAEWALQVPDDNRLKG